MEEAQPKYQRLGCRPGVASTLLEIAMLKAPHLRKSATEEIRKEKVLGGDHMLDQLEEEAAEALEVSSCHACRSLSPSLASGPTRPLLGGSSGGQEGRHALRRLPARDPSKSPPLPV